MEQLRPKMEVRWLSSGIGYEEALEMQDELCAKKKVGEVDGDVFLLLEHAPVYTIGRTRDQSSLRSSAHLPHPVFEINRGGQATYHGPGQLVGYPIIDLRNYKKDLHAYLRLLEEVLIILCKRHGVEASRREGMTGVWVENRKIASLGVGVRKWITQHGFALNVTPESLLPFQSITPCGIDGVQMTCLSNEANATLTSQDLTEEVANILQENLASWGGGGTF